MAIVGAGSGLGAAVARRFGSEGFSVALIARSQGRVDALAAELAEDGITARGFSADVRDLPALTATLESAATALGPIEVLQYSPIPQKEFMLPLLETSPCRPGGACRVLDLRAGGGRPARTARHAEPRSRVTGQVSAFGVAA